MRTHYNDYEIEFFISIIENNITELKDKINSLEYLRDEFLEELKSRGDR